jgi:ABC-type glycerol-3-phosphate transport system permease component
MATQVEATTQARPALRKEKQAGQLSLRAWLIEILKYTVLVVMAASFIFPLYWMASSAIKSDSQIYTIPPIWIPIPAYPQNFYDAWTSYDFNLYAFNSLFRYALPVTLGTTLSSALVAYGFARIRWPGRDILFYICIATMMVPFQVTMVPLFIVFKNLDWINSYKPLVIPAFFGNPYFIFLLRQFFRTIPDELSDAARVDGANEFTIFWRIILPLVKSALVVVGLLTFIHSWNEYLTPLIYLNQQDLYPLALGIENLRRTIFQVGGSSQWAYPYLMAVSTIVVLPILILFYFAQRSLIEGISVTGLKG